MYVDKETIFSNDQSITVTAASENKYDMGQSTDLVQEILTNGIQICCQVTTAFVGGTALYVVLQTDDNEDFNSPVNLFLTQSLYVGELTTGRAFQMNYLPTNLQRYLRLYYVVNGTMSAGAISAALVLDKQQFPTGFYLPVFLVTDDGEYIVTDDGDFIVVGW